MSAVRNSAKLLGYFLADINDALTQLDKAHKLANPDPRTAELLIRDAQRHMERIKNRMPTLRQYLDIADERSSQVQQDALTERLTALEIEVAELRNEVQALRDGRVVPFRERDAG
jgi:polyhydroxyalkanoate synthesis regulator phasin